ncbi:MAG TPA: hypothetical protein VF158_10790, partial [Longimicrobiales bacterium]
MSTPEPARWTDGEPANLAAAATDALDRLEAACEAVTEAIDRIGNSEEAKGVCASAILGRFWITDASNRL